MGNAVKKEKTCDECRRGQVKEVLVRKGEAGVRNNWGDRIGKALKWKEGKDLSRKLFNAVKFSLFKLSDDKKGGVRSKAKTQRQK